MAGVLFNHGSARLKAIGVIGGRIGERKFFVMQYRVLERLMETVYKSRTQRAKGIAVIALIHADQPVFFRPVEVVPILKIERADEARNITDISPLHVEWVTRHMTAAIRNSVLLLKTLLKAHGLYGAESHIRGFSGYVCEILSVHYKGFERLLKSAIKWKPGQVIDTEGYYRTKEEALHSLNASKLGALVVIDPVQGSRNAAAAVSKESLSSFVKLARACLNRPRIGLFKEKPVDEKRLRQRHKGKLVVWLDITPLEGKRDVVGAKILKCVKFFERELKKNGFELLNTGWDWKQADRANAWYIIKSELDKELVVQGPP